MSSTTIIVGLMAGQVATRTRMLVLGALTAASLLIAAVVRFGDANEIGEAAAANQLMTVAFVFVVPMVSLVLAIAGLGDSHHDGTLVYLWLRPNPRWSIAFGSWVAAVMVALPFNVVGAVGTSLILSAGDLVVPAAIAAVLGTFAYVSLFMFFGLIVRNAIVWGIAYVLVWEALIASFGTAFARMALRGYTGSIVVAPVDEVRDLVINPTGSTTSIIVSAVVTVAGVVASTLMLNRVDIE